MRPGYRAALERFSSILGDGHAGINIRLTPEQLPANRWPGFVAVWRGEGLYVYRSTDAKLTPGTEFIGCDGRSMHALVLSNVFAFRGQPTQPGQWWTRARSLFIDRGNPFATLPQQCQIRRAGQILSIRLDWRATDPTFEKWRDESYNGDVRPVGISTPSEGVTWIAMPTFEPDEKQRATYRAMTSSIEQDRASYLKARAIVIDLRGNEGGSSDWSLQLAKALWGATVVDAKIRARDEKTSTWWRASAENTAYFSQIVGQLRGEGQNDVANEVEKIAAGMTAAQRSGQKFFVEPASLAQDSGANRPGVSDQVTPLTAPIYVIVPGQCASACLDAVDVFKLFPAVKLVGAPSSADSAYLEVRMKMLPSGFAEVIIPNKMYVGRARPNGGFYRPDLALADPDWSTAKFLSMIKRDASTKR